MVIPESYNGNVFGATKRSDKRFCCVQYCNANYDKSNSYHMFPKDKRLQKLWKINCRLNIRKCKSMFVCGQHFLVSDFLYGKSKTDSGKPKLMKNAVPLQNLPSASYPRKVNSEQCQKRADRFEKRSIRKMKLEETRHEIDMLEPVMEKSSVEELCKIEIKPELDMETTSYLTVQQALHLAIPIPKKIADIGIQFNTLDDTLPRMNVMDLLTSETTLNSWTGIPTFNLLDAIVDCVCTGYPEEMRKNGLSVKERVLLCFIKLKTNLPFACMTSIFSLSNSSVSRNFNSMLPMIKEALDGVIYFPSTDEIKDNLPIAFRKYGYVKVRAILDCSECKIQLPQCINCRISTYSRYKNGNTFKFMLSITPGRMVSHASKAYSGKSSDKYIFNQERLVEKFDDNEDAIIMDKGKLIEDELLERGLQMVRPSFFQSEREQFDEIEQVNNTKIASLRVHVERAIQRIKNFSILYETMEYNVLPQVNNIIFICAAMANLTEPILSDDKF